MLLKPQRNQRRRGPRWTWQKAIHVVQVQGSVTILEDTDTSSPHLHSVIIYNSLEMPYLDDPNTYLK